jgi:hypothetical protein
MITGIAAFDEKYLRGKLKRWNGTLSRRKNSLKNSLLRCKNHVLIRTIETCNMVLMDICQFPWPRARNLAHKMAWRIGDVAWLLFQFPALSAYKITGAKWTITFVGTRESSLKQVCHLRGLGNL